MNKGLQYIKGRFRAQSATWKFSNVRESIQHWAKQKGELTSFLTLNDSEAKIFQYNFLEGQNVWQNNHYWSLTQRNLVAIMATKPEFLFVKDEMLVVLATISVAILSPGMAFKMLCLC